LTKGEHRFLTPLILVVFSSLLVPPIFTGVPSSSLYSLFLDWLQGRPSGLLKIGLMVPDKGPFYVIVFNYTVPWSEKAPRVLYSDWSQGSPIQLVFKVYRIPEERFLVNDTLKIKYHEQAYAVYIRSKDKIYVASLIVEPKDPITSITYTRFKVFNATPIPRTMAIQGDIESYLMGTTYNFQNIKIGEIHSIPGIKVSWGFTSEDLYRQIRIEMYSRYASISGEDYMKYRDGDYDLNNLQWSQPTVLGKVLTDIAVAGYTSSASGGECKYIIGRVYYEYDMQCIEYPLDQVADFAIFMIPLRLTGYWASSKTFSCSICGGSTPSNYAGKIEAGRQDTVIKLGSGSGATAWSASLSFSIGLTLSAPLQYAGTTLNLGFTFTYQVSSNDVYVEARPKLHVVKEASYVNQDLYYWYKMHADKADEVVHFSWTPPTG